MLTVCLGSVGAFAPRIYKLYRKHMKVVYSKPGMRRNFPNSVYPMVTFNLGPQTVCHTHKDYANFPAWCLILALGDFDPDKGGHIVFWELGLVIRFPPGSTVAVPSSCVHHSNVPIRPGETRFSMTQYASGHLFRFVQNGWKSDKDFMKNRKAWRAELERREGQRAEILGLYTTLRELYASDGSSV